MNIHDAKILIAGFFNQNFFHCTKFRYKNNGIFVLGVVFFASDKFRLFNKPFDGNILSFEKYYCLELKIEKMFHL